MVGSYAKLHRERSFVAKHEDGGAADDVTPQSALARDQVLTMNWVYWWEARGIFNQI